MEGPEPRYWSIFQQLFLVPKLLNGAQRFLEKVPVEKLAVNRTN